MTGVDLIIHPDAGDPTRAIARLTNDTATFACRLGREGIVPFADGREGDGCTPAGRYPVRKVLYREDKITQPQGRLTATAIKTADGWCDAPDDPAYNRAVQLPYAASAEALWRPDGAYDLIIVIGHNDAPVVPGLGSAIFVHVMHDDGRPTLGCVAFRRDDLMAIVRQLGPDSHVEITLPTAAPNGGA